MKTRFAVITAVVVTSLFMSQAQAATPSVGVEPLEFRQLLFLRSVDAQGDRYAESLSYLFVYLHRRGCTFSMDPLTALRENPRARFHLSQGLLTDAKLRASLKEWMKLTVSTITSDFDSLGGVEAVVLSRDALTSSLLSSPRFWEKLTEISSVEKFDFRPVLRREIRGLQFAGNGVAWIVVGGVASAAFRALNLTRVAMVAAAAPAVAITGIAIWDFAQTEDQAPQDAESIRTAAEESVAANRDRDQSSARTPTAPRRVESRARDSFGPETNDDRAATCATA